jgi:hypothetical protein
MTAILLDTAHRCPSHEESMWPFVENRRLMCSLLVPPEDLRVRRQVDTHINVRIGWNQYSLSSYQDGFLARFQLKAILCAGSGQ